MIHFLTKRADGMEEGQCYKEIYSQLRNSLFRSVDSQIEVRSKIWEPLVAPKSGLLNFQKIGVQTTKKNYSIQYLKFPNFLGFMSLDSKTRCPEMFIGSAPDIFCIISSFVVPQTTYVAKRVQNVFKSVRDILQKKTKLPPRLVFISPNYSTTCKPSSRLVLPHCKQNIYKITSCT